MSGNRILTALFVAWALSLGRGFAADTDSDICDAVTEGKIAVVKSLLDKKPDLVREEFYPAKGTRLIHLAVFNNRQQIVALLLDRGADIDAKSIMGTPLQVAVRFGYEDLAELLLRKGARLDFFSAVGLGKVDQVQGMLRENPRLAQSRESPYRMSPLHWASFSGSAKVAKMLLAHGAKPSAADINAWTPLRLAVLFGRDDIVKLLLAHGAKVDSRDDDDETPLCLAVRLRRVETARVLIRLFPK
jgi:ankyrin repeat protein